MGKQWKQWETIFMGCKIIANGDCSHEIKRCLLLERKAVSKLDSILKSRDIADKDPSSQSYSFSCSHVWMWELDHKEGQVPKNWCFWTVVLEKTLENLLDCKKVKPVNLKGNQPWILIGRTATKVRLVKAMVFPVVMYGCESWTVKKADCRRIDAFEMWCWRRLLRIPWTARRSNQSILKEVDPEYSLEVLLMKLKLQYFGHLIWRDDSLEKTLMLEKIEGKRRRGATEDEMVR